MKPAQERNQECLPPKKRDLPVTSRGAGTGTVVAVGAGVGTTVEEEVVSIQNSAANSDAQGGAKSSEWLRAQTAPHYGAESSDSIPAVPVDHYSMLYKVALPSVTYSSSTLHPVLSHISPAYTVHSPLLQHPGLSYPPPLGYAQIPHSSLQFVTSPYAVPYALPPGFVPGSLMSPTGNIPQPHAVSHLVPFPSVVQEGVVSPPPQTQVAAHTFAKVPASGGVPLMLSSEHAPPQHLGTVLPAAELGARGVPVFYHAQGVRGTSAHSSHPGNEREMNGGDKGHGSREALTDVAHSVKNAHLSQLISSSSSQDRHLQACRSEDRSSPSQRSTPDSDLEVQQVVGRLVSSNAGRKEVSFAPLNLSQSTQRSRDMPGESAEGIFVRNVYPSQSVSSSDLRVNSVQQQPVPSGHAVVIANGQPILIPLEYHGQHQSHPPQHYPGQVNSETPNRFKASDSSARVCLPERATGESNTAHNPPAQPTTDMLQAPSTPSTPSHFMKGAIIQLASGELKRVEDLQTQDFVRSAELSGGLKIDSSMVVNILASQQRPGLVSLHFTVGEQQNKVTIDVPPEHPFFVFGQGWSSCSPERTAQLYGLSCHHLQVGDVCVSITLQQQQQQFQAQQQKQPQHNPQPQQTLSSSLGKRNATSGPTHQLMGPPATQQSRPSSHFRIHRERQRDGDKEVLDKEDNVQFVGVGHVEPSIRSSRASAEHPRSHSSYHLHTEGMAAAGQAVASLRRWSSPGLQRYSVKGDEGPPPQMGTARPSFIPQEVKLSIEGRSNAGK